MRWPQLRAATSLSKRILLAAGMAVVACMPDRPVAPGSGTKRSDVPGASVPIGQFSVLHLPTYDGSGETVHPTYAGPPSPWPSSLHYLFVTPYPNGASAMENPSIFAGLDGVAWDSLPNAPDPLIRPDNGTYLSDPEAVYEPDLNELYLYYRQVADSNIINLITSTDGAHWDVPRVVVKGANHTVISPAVVRLSAGDWLMWSVNAGRLGCDAETTTVELRRSVDGLRWSPAQTVALTQPGSWPWHIEVKWIPSRSEYWAVYNTKLPSNCATSLLYLATSPDGMIWTTYPSPMLMAGATPELQDIVYRSTFSYDARTDVITFWYSGARYDGKRYKWSTVMQRRARAEVFAQISRSPAAALFTSRRAPALVNPP